MQSVIISQAVVWPCSPPSIWAVLLFNFFHQFAVRQIWSIPGPPFTHLPNLSLSVVHMLTQLFRLFLWLNTLIICKSLGGKTGRLLRRMWNYSRCHAHSVYLWLMKIRITRNRIKTQVASLSHKLVCSSFCSFELRQEVCVWECWSWPSPVIQSGRCCLVLFFCSVFFPFLFVHVAQLSIALGRHTLPHVRVWKGVKGGGGNRSVYMMP